MNIFFKFNLTKLSNKLEANVYCIAYFIDLGSKAVWVVERFIWKQRLKRGIKNYAIRFLLEWSNEFDFITPWTASSGIAGCIFNKKQIRAVSKYIYIQ